MQPPKTLNAVPADNETVSFMPEDDLTVTAATIHRNGKTIVGEADDLTVDSYIVFTLVFNATNNIEIGLDQFKAM